MQERLLEILKSNWGYDGFRSPQGEIMEAVLQKRDVLALLPTGGGKSLCFQIPALACDGICIVVTPLIALMKDQVGNLLRREISATAIYSGMGRTEIDQKLENCAKGTYKFLYVSPERLQTDLFQTRLKRFNVNLLAVDEAHCISEWGYDFRPSYLKIADIREIIPDSPVLALTATATPRVQEDIKNELRLKEPAVFKKSFRRTNIIFGAVTTENKDVRLKNFLKKVPGSGIVYLRSRAGTEILAKNLSKNGIRCDFYHAGLTTQQRTTKQQNWQNDRTPLIVSTNAFGMGIDKPEVRKVVHLDLPDSLEAYYQEAGRAGRDGKTSYALIITHESDRAQLESRIDLKFPEISAIRDTYHALSNYLQVPVGSRAGQNFDFDLKDFCNRYNLKPLITYNILKILEEENILTLTENAELPSRIMFTVSYRYLYEFQVENKIFEPLIKIILRTCSGGFEDYTRISEKQIATKMEVPEKDVNDLLVRLKKMNIIDYQPARDKPRITFLDSRVERAQLQPSKKRLEKRKAIYTEKIRAMADYAFNTTHCRTRIILNYFGEDFDQPCGHCDNCLKSKDKNKPSVEISQNINALLKTNPLTYDALLSKLRVEEKYTENQILDVFRMLRDEGNIFVDKNGLIHYKD